MKEYLTKEEISKFNNLKKSEQYMKLMEDNNSLRRENLFLKKDLEKKGKINLYVEGKTDKKYIKKAMEILGINLKINIINCGGANNVITNLAGVIDDGIGGIHVGLLDLDSGGITSRIGNNLSNLLFTCNDIKWKQKGYFGNRIMENFLNLRNGRGRYSMIFIPRIDDFKNQIFKRGLPYLGEIEDNNQLSFLERMNIFNGTNLETPIFETEHLIYDDRIEEIKKNFKIIELPGGGRVVSFGNKKKKEELCRKIINGDIKLSIGNWENFSTIFKYIDEIQKSD